MKGKKRAQEGGGRQAAESRNQTKENQSVAFAQLPLLFLSLLLFDAEAFPSAVFYLSKRVTAGEMDAKEEPEKDGSARTTSKDRRRRRTRDTSVRARSSSFNAKVYRWGTLLYSRTQLSQPNNSNAVLRGGDRSPMCCEEKPAGRKRHREEK